MNDLSARRANMVNSQVLTNKVTDERVSDALLAVARERFVPKSMIGVAYIDEELEIGKGRFLLEPMIFARMLQLAEINRDDLVLDIGAALGYSTAVLAQLAGTVVGLEAVESLVEEGNDTLNELGIDNAALVAGPMAEGLADQGPFDLIFVNGAIPKPSEVLLAQLKDDGRILTVERSGQVGQVVFYERSGETVARRILFDAMTAQLPGFEVEAEFAF